MFLLLFVVVFFLILGRQRLRRVPWHSQKAGTTGQAKTIVSQKIREQRTGFCFYCFYYSFLAG